MHDVLVAGGGPAGWALAAACARVGLDTELIDPTPQRPWRATYAGWLDELPVEIAGSAVAATAAAVAVGTRTHRLGWDYAVLDNPALHAHLAGSGVPARQGMVRAVRRTAGGVQVDLGAGPPLRARLLIDATGTQRLLTGDQPPPLRRMARQSAVGVTVDAAAAADLVSPGTALFMDWRPDHGQVDPPSFLYGVPIGRGRVLLEETCLAGRPALALGVLNARLTARLRAHGIEASTRDPERVRFVLDRPLPPRATWNGPVVPFGASAPLTHPATGFGVATALRMAPAVAGAIRTGLPAGAEAAARAAWQTVWSRRAIAVHALRRQGLRALLGMPADELPRFFDAFFALPPRHRWRYLTERDDVAGTVAAMAALFGAAPWRPRWHLVWSIAHFPRMH